jgi:Tfp pilus assembly protein PilZ
MIFINYGNLILPTAQQYTISTQFYLVAPKIGSPRHEGKLLIPRKIVLDNTPTTTTNKNGTEIKTDNYKGAGRGENPGEKKQAESSSSSRSTQEELSGKSLEKNLFLTQALLRRRRNTSKPLTPGPHRQFNSAIGLASSLARANGLSQRRTKRTR